MRVTKLQHEKNESQTKNNTPKHGKRTTKSETASERQRTQGKWTKTNGQEDENKKKEDKKKEELSYIQNALLGCHIPYSDRIDRAHIPHWACSSRRTQLSKKKENALRPAASVFDSCT